MTVHLGALWMRRQAVKADEALRRRSREHEVIVKLERLDEDVLAYATASGERRVAVLDHSAVRPR